MSRLRRPLYSLMCVCCLAFLADVPFGFADYEVIEVTDGGTIKGQAIWKGAIPKVPPLRVFADMDTCGTEVPSPALRIDPATNGIQQVLVYLERVERGKAAEPSYHLHLGKRDTDLAVHRCQFQEQVFPFVRTAEVALINFEPILHNPHLFNDKQASLFNIAMPTANREIATKVARARGIGLRLQCDVHVHVRREVALMIVRYEVKRTCASVRSSLSAQARLVTVGSEAAETTYPRPSGRGGCREGAAGAASIRRLGGKAG